MQQFKDLLGQVFEHNGTHWRISKVGNPGGYTWKIQLLFEPAEWEREEEA